MAEADASWGPDLCSLSCLGLVLGSWGHSGLIPAAPSGAPAQKVGRLWSGQGTPVLDPAFPDTYFQGLWKLGNLIRRLG